MPTSTPFVPQSDSLAAGLLYFCQGRPWPIEILDGPPDPGERPEVALAAEVSGEELPTSDWWLVRATETERELVRTAEPSNEAGDQYVHIRVERDDKGDWRAHHYGGCRLTSWVGDLQPDVVPLGWWIAQKDWPRPDDRVLRVKARDWCPDTVHQRLGEPVIRYGGDSILIIATYVTEAREDAPCGEGQVAAFNIELSEPVGDRDLLDGKTWPAHDARVPIPEQVWCCG